MRILNRVVFAGMIAAGSVGSFGAAGSPIQSMGATGAMGGSVRSGGIYYPYLPANSSAQPGPTVRYRLSSAINRGAPFVPPNGPVPAVRAAPIQIVPPKSAAARSESPTNTIHVIEGTAVFDENRGILDYQRAKARRGNPEAQYALGMRFLLGIGVRQDEELGWEWLRTADRNGNLRARSRLMARRAEARRAMEAARVAADREFLAARADRSEKDLIEEAQ